MKKLILILFLLCFVISGCGKKESKDTLSGIYERDKLIVGVRNDTRPFGFIDKNGQYAGYDIDLAKIAAKNILGSEDKIEFVPVNASNRIRKLNSAEVDMLVATMSVTEQRKQIMDFSTPYHMAGQAIMVNKKSKATTLKDFRGKKLIMVFGSTSEGNIRTNLPDVEILGYKTYVEAFNALKAGKADGIVADDTILIGFAMDDKSVKILPKRYSQEFYAIAFRKEPESKRLIEKVNYIIDNLQTTKQIDKLQEKWGIPN